MPAGQIVKAISGFYFVQTSENERFQCRARGKFRFQKKKKTPLVGDFVQFDKTGLDEGMITFVQPRSTELSRPPIANVDQAIVVCSLKQPEYAPMPLDRFLVHAERENLRIVICLTKKDLVEDARFIQQLVTVYQEVGYPVITTSIYTDDGLEALQQMLVGRTSVFAGQSGVGKSSLLNRLIPDLQLETKAVSRKLGRGRHTTRQVELLTLDGGGQVADTPGFSQLSFQGMEPEELRFTFPEFAEYQATCRYRGCLHDNETECQVKEAVHQGEISMKRYQHYRHFLNEMKDQRRY